jgi:hypothetical protein
MPTPLRARADGRHSRALTLVPLLFVLFDEAYRSTQATARANIDKSAFYEAVFITALDRTQDHD